ncbi:hypothetical protein [Paenibacillus flagellatus]|uniref:ArpU family transcriptional regulator n=1 Tax=Paenibacillus flagellatus TaxID=2211139 RepID=A0A2V5K554_9BACL|nr:hypothetical protein [Paenibacillus flagellatus]PYI54495.1 hypothetical protein DLM86_13600 [Paenibacillus flagellatus]
MDKPTRRMIEEMLIRSRFYKSLVEDEPEVVMGYTDPEQGKRYAETTEQRRQFILRIERAVSKLASIEKELIERRYLQVDSDYLNDHHVYNAMQISHVPYRKIRARAFEKLAEALGITRREMEDVAE